NESASDRVSETNTTPVKFLENYLADYIDSPNMKLSVSINKVSKNFDLNSIKGDYKWEIDKLKKGLADIINLKKVFINADKSRYLVELEVSVIADVYISKKSFVSGDYINKDLFIKKTVDIAAYSNGEQLVFDINKADKSKFVKDFGAGEVLRWSSIKKIPLVVKGEELKVVIKKNRTTVTIFCESMQDAYENEKIRVKLANKKEKIGILRERDGDKYVEI
ncbi:MAG TPA: flagella basal body P-ring formation protein FlgA, partial [Spirochaetota bacterium]|nr:flagella basal body P-ring formation protein FlgA [Spirochaetota bacterium]